MHIRPATRAVARLLVEWSPVFINPRAIADELDISYHTARHALSQLERIGALEHSHARRSSGLRDILPLDHPVWDEVAR